jgi:N-acetylneuraminic acid mutarotase
MQTTRYTLASGVVGGKVYAVGGENYSEVFGVVEQYDPVSDDWAFRKPMLTPRASAAVAVVGGKLYAIGGSATTTGSALLSVEAYDPVADSWVSKASMGMARWALAAAVLNGVIYAVGGYNGSPLATVEAYDPATDSWSLKAPLPSPRSSLAVVAACGKLYAIGGHDTQGLNTVDAYDPSTNSWTSVASMPTARWTHAAAAVNGMVYVIGGNDVSGLAIGTVEAFNPGTNSWTSKPSMPTPRLELTAAPVDNTIFALGGLGGLDNATLFNTNEALAIEPFLTVVIDIKPGSFPNSINLGSAGSVPVAILSNACFDATQVNPDSVTLAGAPVRLIARGSRYQCSAQDVNGDGRADLMCHVETAQFMLEPGDTIAELRATTFGGGEVRGQDSIRLVP